MSPVALVLRQLADCPPAPMVMTIPKPGGNFVPPLAQVEAESAKHSHTSSVVTVRRYSPPVTVCATLPEAEQSVNVLVTVWSNAMPANETAPKRTAARSPSFRMAKP